MPNHPDRLKWGPYLSNRQWGTVREDYSNNGDAWNSTTHDQARSRAWRWGEEGIGGISDDQQQLCFAPAFWNGQDPILKERFFGLTNGEGNHGEDIKELFYYLDSAPDHRYLRMLYKYPQAAYPYTQLLQENQRRTRLDPEFELLDTGIFDLQRYFDIFIEYAKAGPEDILVRITACNRGPDAAPLTVLPTIWLRNTWAFGLTEDKPEITVSGKSVKISHAQLGIYYFLADGAADWLFCENETNNQRLFNAPNTSPSCKDGINDFIVQGQRQALNKNAAGTKVAALFQSVVPAGGEEVFRMRLTRENHSKGFTGFNKMFTQRQAETDAFFAELQGGMKSAEARNVQRQAYAGMLWNKQFYAYDVARWLDGDPGEPPPPPERLIGRNSDWRTLISNCILSMPDKWEYPWFAAWDLAFHCLPLVRLDPDFAKGQLEILFSEQFQRENGQVPAYEWNFDDLNPPVKAWATWQVFNWEKQKNGGQGDREFLQRMFKPLLNNYLWWVHQKDNDDNDLFGGGFLGLDNIGVFDRSKPLDSGDKLEQADATAWVAFCALYMFRIAVELNEEVLATEFFEHFLRIAAAVGQTGSDHDLWDDEDEFFYDHLRFPDGTSRTLEVRSMVGLIPMFAVLTLTDADLAKVPDMKTRMEAILQEKPHLAAMISRWHDVQGDSRLLSLLRGHRTKALLRLMLDPREFWSEHGVRSLSRRYLEEPYTLHHDGGDLTINYVPGDSDSGMFGGNSNWRGPVWMPVNYLLVESLREFYRYYGPDFLVEYPIGAGQEKVTLAEVADEITRRLTSLFLPNEKGERPIHGQDARYASDPYFRDLVLFHEYFHGDTGQGLGASHQTGWTGLVAVLLENGSLSPSGEG